LVLRASRFSAIITSLRNEVATLHSGTPGYMLPSAKDRHAFI
jgi:hypothetical protein